jgi:tryptophan 7-halogenase
MSIPSPIQRIAVIGASSAGLLAALTLKQFFPQLQVTILYSSDHSPIGVGESTTAWLPQFLHDRLKIDRAEFYQAVCPIWKLGIRFEWGQPGEHFLTIRLIANLAMTPTA